MRIAVYHNLPSGGGKRTLHEQVKRLARRHQIDLFSPGSANQSFADVRAFVQHTVVLPFAPGNLFSTPFGRLNQGVRIVDLLRLRRVMRSLAEQINLGDYDVALVHPCMFTFSPTALRHLRVPSVYYRQDPVRWLHEPKVPRPYYRNGSVRQRLDRLDPLYRGYFRLLSHEDERSMWAATRVLTNSYFMRESLYRLYGLAPFVCYHGVDTQLFRPLDLARQPYVLSVGAIAPHKGYDFLIQSLACIPVASRPSLILVGNVASVNEQRYLTQLAAQLEVEVDFRQLVSDDELVRFYNQALCTVYAPVLEPFGLAPLESMACGTPVVGVREGGVRETVVHGETGLLTDRDPQCFADAVASLLQDATRRERYGQQGRTYVESQWQWDRSVAELERHLLGAVRQRAG